MPIESNPRGWLGRPFRRRRTIWWALLLLCAPSLYRLLQNDLVVSNLLEGVPVPPGAEELGVVTRVGEQDGSCRIAAGRLFATQLTPRELASRSVAADGAQLRFAWAEPGRFVVATWEAGELVELTPVPSTAAAALAKWMIMPNGVRRVLVFREAPTEAFAEVRCLGAFFG